LDGESFFHCGIREFELESRNTHFVYHRPFLMDISETTLIRAFGFGNAVEAHIPDHIERIGRYCFEGVDWFGPVHFGPHSKVQSIEEYAFADCKLLSKIWIPSSVTFLGQFCFYHCYALVDCFGFSAGSQLSEIQCNMFDRCQALKSIAIPASVEAIGRSCFSNCEALALVSFPADSRLVRIDESAFFSCSSLRRFELPSPVEFVGKECFASCSAMTEFVFVSPPHVRELLDLPRKVETSLAIPDCVEVLRIPSQCSWDVHSLTLEFGRESRLTEVRMAKGAVAFLRVTSSSLKVFRRDQDFADPKDPKPAKTGAIFNRL
jgi:hypothetical protein